MIGGTGVISTSVTRRLLEQGWDVTLLNRGQHAAVERPFDGNVRQMIADINDEARVAELLGPGDRGHADHWHLAFYTGDQTRPLDRAQIVVARAERGVGGLTSAAVQPMASYEAAPAPQARVMAARPNAAPISVAVNFRRDMLHPSPTDPTADPRFIPRTITASN